MATLQDGQLADSTSDPKKTGGRGNKARNQLKMLESKKLLLEGWLLKKNELSWLLAGERLQKKQKKENWKWLLSCVGAWLQK